MILRAVTIQPAQNSRYRRASATHNPPARATPRFSPPALSFRKESVHSTGKKQERSYLSILWRRNEKERRVDRFVNFRDNICQQSVSIQVTATFTGKLRLRMQKGLPLILFFYFTSARLVSLGSSSSTYAIKIF